MLNMRRLWRFIKPIDNQGLSSQRKFEKNVILLNSLVGMQFLDVPQELPGYYLFQYWKSHGDDILATS